MKLPGGMKETRAEPQGGGRSAVLADLCSDLLKGVLVLFVHFNERIDGDVIPWSYLS